VWLWKDNPAGLFAPFNPRVSCDGRERADDSDRPGVLAVDRARQFACDIRSGAA
jgi:hypothetical protein